MCWAFSITADTMIEKIKTISLSVQIFQSPQKMSFESFALLLLSIDTENVELIVFAASSLPTVGSEYE